MRKVIPYLLCILLLAGCSESANLPRISPSPVATVATTPAVSFDKETPSLSEAPASIVPDNSENVLSNEWVTIPQDQEPYFLLGTKLSQEFLPEKEGQLTGNSLTYEQIVNLGKSLYDIPHNEMYAALERAGVEMEQPFPCEFTVHYAQCMDVMDGKYVRMYIALYGSRENINLFFRKEGDLYTPHSYIYYSATRGDSKTSFQNFADQDWMVYEVYGGSGLGYVEDWTVWYNLTTCCNEIGYLSRYHNDGNVASSVYEMQGIDVLTTNVVDVRDNSVLKLSVHMQLETMYWITQEDIENGLPAPEPDKIVAQTQVQLNYDKTEHAFYIRTLPEAYPLSLNYDRSQWLIYVGDSIYRLLNAGNDYQKQWAELFYK
ncbi:MAG: hypothetical protein BWY11_00243 [Firmicutes bacterium ADurb.Bin182]|nr:MAG: hypothetical protein BWY11_00243 [Firmicutes bacterium ADurb.Bin182]